ncbi:hypothetical protein D3C80_448480 [compost metagenome]
MIITLNKATCSKLIYPIVAQFENMPIHSVSMGEVMDACNARADELGINGRWVFDLFIGYACK